MSTFKALEVPIAANGDMLHWPRFGMQYSMRVLEPFEMALSYDGYERGRSAMTFYWRAETGVRYPMFLSDFDILLNNGVVAFGKVWGIWTPVRKSGYFGLKHSLPDGE